MKCEWRRKIVRIWFFLKPPLQRGVDEADCGPAALLTVLRYHGGRTTLAHMRDLCRTDSYGTTFKDMVRAAKLLGFESRGATGDYSELAAEKMPCIAHIVLGDGRQHFVVLFRISARGVRLGDPADRVRRLSPSRFKHLWREKAVILFKPGPDLLNEPADPWWGWLWKYAVKSGPGIWISLFWSSVNALLGLAIVVYMQRLFDVLLPGKKPSQILLSGLFLLILMVVRAVAGYCSSRFVFNLNRNSSRTLMRDLFQRMFRLPPRWFHNHKRGELVNRIVNNSRIQSALLMVLHSAVGDLLIIAICAVSMLFIVPSFFIFLLLLLIGSVFVLWGRTRILRRAQARLIRDSAAFHAYLVDLFCGVDVILSFATADNFSRICAHLHGELTHNESVCNDRQARMELSLKLCSALHTVAVLSYGAFSVCYQSISLGQMMAGFYLISMAMSALGRSLRVFISLGGAPASVERLQDILQTREPPHSGTNPFHMERGLAVTDGSFAWPKQPLFLKEISMELKRGEMTALRGPCGSGKSTLAQILQQQYALTSGHLWIDGVEAGRINLTDYRRNVALIPQQIKLFNGTVVDNILVGRPFYSLQQIQDRACELGFAAPFCRLRRGFYTQIGENGQRLSAGEQVALALLRALFNDPAAVLCDECFGHLDSAWQNLFYAVLRHYSRDHVVFLITHHSEWISQCDRIYELREGRVRMIDARGSIEQGDKVA